MKNTDFPRLAARRRTRKAVPKIKLSAKTATDAAPRETVPAIIEQWKRERPDLDFQPMLVFATLARTYLTITKSIDDLVAEYGLARGMFDVLATLRRSGTQYSHTPKQLAGSLLLSGAGMTNRLDRLEELKLIVRKPQAGDRRSLQIQLTEKGLYFVDKILPDVLALQSQASMIGVQNSQKLVRLLSMIIEQTEQTSADD
jgi:DNA-binding MarR family transcriptional regulator